MELNVSFQNQLIKDSQDDQRAARRAAKAIDLQAAKITSAKLAAKRREAARRAAKRVLRRSIQMGDGEYTEENLPLFMEIRRSERLSERAVVLAAEADDM